MNRAPFFPELANAHDELSLSWRRRWQRALRILTPRTTAGTTGSPAGRPKACIVLPLACFIIASLLTTPTLAQQDGAPELTLEASQAIDKGLKYLLSTQHKDGSWSSDGKGVNAVASTSLALMAFMSMAEFPGFGPHGKQLNRGMKWLLKEAKKRPDGYMGAVMYEHGFATLALSEMWGMTRDTDDNDAIQKALEKAVEVILRSQNPGGGWRYQPQADGGEDLSCTMTVFHALASARQAGIVVPNETIAKVVKYLKNVHDAETGGFTYNEKAAASFPCTAGGAYIAQLAGQRDTEMVNAAIRHLKSQAPGIFTGARYYSYGHYYAIQTMVQAGDEEYSNWYPQIRDALISKQNTMGAWGSASKQGISYETPMAIIILATPHRYIPIYQR
jgi:squalene cyclase